MDPGNCNIYFLLHNLEGLEILPSLHHIREDGLLENEPVGNALVDGVGFAFGETQRPLIIALMVYAGISLITEVHVVFFQSIGFLSLPSSFGSS